MNVQLDATTTLTIFCDGSCPVCAIEVDMLRKRDRNGQLSWIDISAPDFDAGAHGFVHADLDAVIHGVRSDGSVLRGLDVLSVAYGAAGFGGLVALTRARWLKGPSDAAYRLFARHRYRVSRVLCAGAAPDLAAPRRRSVVMNVLVCGSTGCIGTAVVASLRWRGHRVVEASRRAGDDDVDALPLDFMNAVDAERWAKRLVDGRIDAIVNCVGILMPGPGESFERIHHEGPAELFRGAARAGVARIVQVSALGIDARVSEPGAYLGSKQRGDDALLALGLDSAVVRPSLVFGPRSESARLFATLASLPVIGLPGRGEQRVQPIHVWELAESIARLVERTGGVRGVYEIAGDAPVSYRAMLAAYRDAQNLGPALWLPLPLPLMRLGARVAEWLPQRVYCRDTLTLLQRGNVSDRNAAPMLLGRSPSSLAEGLTTTPPETAIDVKVRLAPVVRDALRIALAFLWLYTAAVSVIWPHTSGVLELLARCGFAGDAGWLALCASCTLNVSLGVATLRRPTVVLYAVQIGAVLCYTAVAAFHVPQLTIDHCGPLAKNALLVASIALLWLEAAGRAVASDRAAQTSMFATRSALLSMKWRRGSTSSPISIVKTRSASIASSS